MSDLEAIEQAGAFLERNADSKVKRRFPPQQR